jgi:hypothetical protein
MVDLLVVLSSRVKARSRHRACRISSRLCEKRRAGHRSDILRICCGRCVRAPPEARRDCQGHPAQIVAMTGKTAENAQYK